MERYHTTNYYLNNCVSSDILANVYIFYGPDEEGRAESASWLANIILKPRQNGFCPDLLVISPDENGRILIDKAREIKRFLSLSPLTLHKVVIVSKAERLAEASQSTLLKILEEAPSYAVVIMLSRTLDSILPTIVSRSIKIPFWKIKSGSKVADKKLSDCLIKLITGTVPERYAITDKILKETPEASYVFDEWLYFFRELFLKKLKGDNSVLIRYNEKETLEILTKIHSLYIKIITTNFNPKFAYDELILALK